MTFARAGLLMAAGPLAWAAHFAAIYGFTGIACARGIAGAVPWAIAAFTLVAAGVVLAVIVTCLRRRESFEHWLAATLAGAALVAILWEAIPALLVPACA
jgi:heme/copper-type cytochrome/quinol oxidase subunit 2